MRARCMPGQTCGPWAKARWWRAFSRCTSKRSGSGNRRRVAVRAGQRDRDEVALGDRRAGELHVARRVAVDDRRRRLQPQRLLHGVAQQRRVGPHCAQLGRVREQVVHGVGDHALRRLDAAEQDHAGVGDHARVVSPRASARAASTATSHATAQTRRMLSSSSAKAAWPSAVRAGPPRRPPPRRRCGRTSRARPPCRPGRDPASAPSPRPRAARRRRGEARTPPPAGGTHQPVGLRLDELGEALPHLVEPERTGERPAVARVLGAVERSMLGPTTCPVENRGSSTVKVSASRMTASTTSRRETTHACRTGSQEMGSAARRRASRRCGSASSPRASRSLRSGTRRGGCCACLRSPGEVSRVGFFFFCGVAPALHAA